jgi:hypothetical protein
MSKGSVEAMRNAIRRAHGCDSTWVKSITVVDRFLRDVIWQSEVHVFELTNHQYAEFCYVWPSARGTNLPLLVIVIGLAPVYDAASAVRHATALGR